MSNQWSEKKKESKKIKPTIPTKIWLMEPQKHTI